MTSYVFFAIDVTLYTSFVSLLKTNHKSNYW